ncbi:MAG: sulfatase-like hydrolase/transferase [Rhizobiaceae bacterium]
MSAQKPQQTSNQNDNGLRRMFSRDSLKMAFAMAVVPNILFVATSPLFLAERLISPLLYVAVGLLSLILPTWLGITLFLLVAIVDLGLITMFAFHLPINVAIDSIRYTTAIDVGASLFYIAVVSGLLFTTLYSFYLIKRNRFRFRAASPIPAVIIAMSLSYHDWTNTYPYFVQPGGNFDSARIQGRLTDETIIRQRKNLLIVMVEGLGAFVDDNHRALFDEKLTANLPENRFTFTRGNNFFKGSTTGAAARELCGFWGDYLDFLENTEIDSEMCLPNILADHGYKTSAYHAFGTHMFLRDQWYPKIGFKSLHFQDELLQEAGEKLPGRCGSVFSGLCDLEVADLVKSELTNDEDDPKFVYWLTLNTHIPYVKEINGPLQCNSANAAIGNDTVCELTELWLEVMEKVNEIATDPNLPPTDILIVGDHHTPLWERDAKDHFILNKVDWYLLRDNRKSETTTLALN